MSFLQPWMLAALPLAALPIVIHLINQRRFQTIDWAAMRFLLEANRMSRGYARLRQWLILLFRVLAIVGLIAMVSRPLASGWLGLSAGSRPDTTLLLVDRSPSMAQHGAGTVSSKLETGIAQLTQTLSTLGSSKWVLIDSVGHDPTELASPAELPQTVSAHAWSEAADVPAMLQAAHDYMKNNHTGQAEIWICSDLRAKDWNAESGRWQNLRDAFQEFKQSVRFHLLAYPAAADDNVSVRVTDVERRSTGDGAALLLSVALKRSGGEGKRSVPLQFEIEGSRSELTVEMEGPEFEVKNHRIELANDRAAGWGRVVIPADENPADNEFYFVFSEPPPCHTIVVTDNPTSARPLEIAAGSSPDPDAKSDVKVTSPEAVSGLNWDEVALVLWQAPLPTGDVAQALSQFVDRGGQVVFLPPREPTGDEIFGIHWTEWATPPEPVRVETWRGDQDLLARTQSGAALPVGELSVRRYCGLEGEHTSLATMYGGAPLLARVTSDRGGIYFCSTTAANTDASLASDGVAMYVAIQRALAAGAAELASVRQVVAGESFPTTSHTWQQLAGDDSTLSNEYPAHAGVYAAGDFTLAVNRSEAEDRSTTLGDARVAELFHGLDFDRVDNEAGNLKSLAREVWRICLGAMMCAMIFEAGLCLPRKRPAKGGTT